MGRGSPGGRGAPGGGRGKGGGRGGKAPGGKGKGKGKGAKGGAKVVVEPHRHLGVYVARGKEDVIVTKNSTPGEAPGRTPTPARCLRDPRLP